MVHTCFTTSSAVASSSLGSLILHSHSPLITNDLIHSDVSQRSKEWFDQRREKLTTSTFSTALGIWKGKRREELWQEKVYPPKVESFTAAARAAMNWGVVNEDVAISGYKNITGRDVSFLGFATHTETSFSWLGASPDGLLGSCPGGGILEVKCPYNKGKPELGIPWSTMPFYYMPQVQGQMEVLDRDWVDLYCWTPNASAIFRVCRDRSYWDLIYGILYEFWWENVVPAKELLKLEREEDVKAFVPSSVHRQTGYVIGQSIKLAAASKLLCREISGHVEYYK
ncbi:hypothetical protein GIB67_022952 [Kingdonia uniflora]|uniref:YqaJ viral recombinase domain-containing protein n=1 Tax=Kingdonia uniflora TaxID=39325 RepID=A0A7J7P2P6_9MAGN|nr:hypothetical protein GIB67_022952 [Kingdonia uniflora]